MAAVVAAASGSLARASEALFDRVVSPHHGGRTSSTRLETRSRLRYQPSQGLGVATQELLQQIQEKADISKQSTVHRKLATYSNQIATVQRIIGDELTDEPQAKNNVRLHPNCLFRAIWDVLLIVCVLYTTLVFPVYLAFGVKQEPLGLRIFQLLTWVVFCVDIALYFNTGYVQGVFLVMDRNKVFWHYVSTWLVVDVVSCVPYEIISLSLSSRTGTAFYVLVVLRLCKLFRLPRLFISIDRWEEHLGLNKVVMRVIKLFMIILLFVHYAACVKVYAGLRQLNNAQSWMVVAGIDDATGFEQYSWALLMAMSQLWCIGYGPYSPYTLTDIWITFFTNTLGATLNVVLLGTVTMLLLSVDRAGREYMDKQEEWRDFCKCHGVDDELRRRVAAHWYHAYFPSKAFKEQVLLNDLPVHLRTDVQMALCQEVVQSCPLFLACSEKVARAAIARFQRAPYSCGELIFQHGTPRYMCIVASGTVMVESHKGTVAYLQQGGVFGEELMVEGSASTLKVVLAVTDVQLYIMTEDDFDEICLEHPQFKSVVEILSKYRTTKFSPNQEMDSPTRSGPMPSLNEESYVPHMPPPASMSVPLVQSPLRKSSLPSRPSKDAAAPASPRNVVSDFLGGPAGDPGAAASPRNVLLDFWGGQAGTPSNPDAAAPAPALGTPVPGAAVQGSGGVERPADALMSDAPRQDAAAGHDAVTPVKEAPAGTPVLQETVSSTLPVDAAVGRGAAEALVDVVVDASMPDQPPHQGPVAGVGAVASGGQEAAPRTDAADQVPSRRVSEPME